MRKVDIKTGFLCNNNCQFCVQADNKLKGNRSFEEIKRDLLETKGLCDGVVFTGGEVTIRDDFFELVKLAKELDYKAIQIQTNGRMFASMDFCKRTIAAGATEFSPSLHGYCADQHDSLTRSSRSFIQTIKGIRNLKSLGAFVMTNTVVTISNYQDLPKIARLLINLNMDQFQFAFVHPMGNAWKNFDDIVPSISLAAPFIKKAIQIGIDAGIRVMAEAMPYCLMKGFEDHLSENNIPETMVRGVKFQNTDDFTHLRKTEGKIKFTKCRLCIYDAQCEGPWKEYPSRFGDSEFRPIVTEPEALPKDIENKILEVREILMHSNINSSDRLLILQVCAGIKPAASFDYINDRSRIESIMSTLDNLGIYYRSVEKEGITKILFGNKNNVDKLYEINHDLLKDIDYKQYGTLFGYPECCLKLKLDDFTGKHNILFNRYSGIPLIFHSPCSFECEQSVKLAKNILSLYYCFDKRIYKTALLALTKPIIKFNDNLMIKFDDCIQKGKSFSYRSISAIIPSPIDEKDGCNDKYIFILDKIKLGNLLYVTKADKLKIYNNEELIAKIDISEGISLLNFGIKT